MIPFPHSRFRPPGPHDSIFQDVPEVLCDLCERDFEQFDPDERICEDCSKCKKCGARIERSLIRDSEFCMWCRDQLSEPQPNNDMTRQEHLQWCKQRALQYCDAGDPTQAFTSMCSDLSKHPDTENHPGAELGMGLLMIGDIATPDKMREFIEGFH